MKDERLVPLSNDLAFKSFFKKQENRRLLISLLESFLPLPQGSKILDVAVLDPELPPEAAARVGGREGKRYVLDLRARFQRTGPDGARRTETANVECQTTSHSRMTDRMLAYACRLYGEQLRAGDDYAELNPVYSLLFATKNLPEFADASDYEHVCAIQRTRPPHSLLSRSLSFVVVELGKFDRGVGALVDLREEWRCLIKNADEMSEDERRALAARGDVMTKAVKSLWNMSQEEGLRELLAVEERNRKDQRAREGDAREEGREEERRRLALSMLGDGFKTEVVCKHTGFSESEMAALMRDLRLK